MVYNFFDKKAGDTSTQIGTGVPENQELAKGLHRFITIKCERAKVHWLYWDNIWAADLANIQSIDKYNKGIRLWWVLLIFKANVRSSVQERKRYSQWLVNFKNFWVRMDANLTRYG